MSGAGHATTQSTTTRSTVTCSATPSARSPPVHVASVTSPFTAAVIFLHGVGSTGDELRTQLSHLAQPSLESRFPHIRFIFPTAPLRSFTAFKGRVLPAWFDRAGYGLQWDEDAEGLRDSCVQLNELVQQCNAEGISHQRIVIGGFSMGGAQAIHAAFSTHGAASSLFSSTVMPTPLAGCFCIASYLPRSCLLPSTLSSDSLVLATPLLFMHGASDSIVRPSWAEDTCRRMKQAGVLCLFNMYDAQIHALSSPQLDDLSTFIGQFLPRDIKAQPALPSASASATSQGSQQQQQQLHHQQHQQSQQYHPMEEQLLKSAQRTLPLLAELPKPTGEARGVSAYLETLKPLNTDLR